MVQVRLRLLLQMGLLVMDSTRRCDRHEVLLLM